MNEDIVSRSPLQDLILTPPTESRDGDLGWWRLRPVPQEEETRNDASRKQGHPSPPSATKPNQLQITGMRSR